MPMDDTEKKLLCMLNAPSQGERANAVELLNAHQRKRQHFCSAIVYEAENSVPLQQYTDEVNEHNNTKAWLQQYMAANAKLAKQLTICKAAVSFKNIILPQIITGIVFFGSLVFMLWILSFPYSWIT